MRESPTLLSTKWIAGRPFGRAAFLVDFDGTLVEIGSTPDAVEVSGELIDLVRDTAHRLEGRLAIVSGRSLRQLEALWGDTIDGLVLAGSHGQELKIEGSVDGPVHTDLFTLLADQATSHFRNDAGVVIEEKTFGLGLHYRLAASYQDEIEGWAREAAAKHDLIVQKGDMVFELRPKGADKGDAVRAIMTLGRFQGSSPIYIGDDFTDIPAFRAVQAMGGLAISVGPRIVDHSDEQLGDVASVLRLIREIAA